MAFRTVLIFLLLPSLPALSQQPSPGSGGAPQTKPPSQPPPASTGQAKASALDDPLLQAADEDDVVTDLFSRVSFEYDHGNFNGGSENDRFRIKGQQAFGPRERLAVGYELPFI